MLPAASLLVTASIVTLMVSMGPGLKAYPFVLLRDRPAFLVRVLQGTVIVTSLFLFRQKRELAAPA